MQHSGRLVDQRARVLFFLRDGLQDGRNPQRLEKLRCVGRNSKCAAGFMGLLGACREGDSQTREEVQGVAP